MNVFTLSLWENFWWGLIYFDQYTTQNKFVELKSVKLCLLLIYWCYCIWCSLVAKVKKSCQ